MKDSLYSQLLTASAFSCLACTNAMEASPFTFYETQPDGSLIALREHGDEKENWVSDLHDYTVVTDNDGFFVYAAEGSNGDLVASTERVGKTAPRIKGKKKGPGKAGKNCFKQICGGIPHHSMSVDVDLTCEGKKCPKGSGKVRGRHLVENDPGPDHHDRRLIETMGVKKNLVVLLYFNDHEGDSRSVPSVGDIDTLMNHDGPHPLCPTGSVKDVYHEISYNQLTIESHVVPWFVTSRDESWYADGKSGTTNLHEAIREALDHLDDEGVVDFSDFDEDGDGYIDAITVLHSGYGAEWGGTDCHGTQRQNRIWSHKWKLWSDSSGKYVGPWVSSDNVKVWDYHISPALWDTCGDDIGRVGVIAHETGHFLGIPDLYDRDGGGRGLGGYDMMASSWGFDGSQLYPGHMSCWSKLQMGWVQPVTPSYGVNFIFNLEEHSTEPQCYKIHNGFPQGEYLLIECRQQKGIDLILPRGGLAIYHIDERADWDTEGFPGQSGWPQNGKHYRVALCQADGFYNLEKGDNKGGTRDFFHAEDVDHLLPSTDDPKDGPFPNTDSYQRGALSKTNIQITDISISGTVMSFTFTDGEEPLPTDIPSAEPSSSPSSQPSAEPTETVSSAPSISPSPPPSDEPSTSPTLKPSESPSRNPSVTPTSSPSISVAPSNLPSPLPSVGPSTSSMPSSNPSTSVEPSEIPSSTPSSPPSASAEPSASPTDGPTLSLLPSFLPSSSPSDFVCREKKEPCERDEQCCANKCDEKKGECKK